MPDPLRFLILGASGRLGGALVRRLGLAHEVIQPTHAQADLAHPTQAIATLRRAEFDVLINCAAVTSPDVCEADPRTAWVVNAETPGALAALCQERGVRMIHVSTDYVFAGDRRAALTEADPAQPISIYGETKRAGEVAVLAACPSALVGRVSWLFGPDKPSFPDTILNEARHGGTVQAIADKWSTPTCTEDLAGWMERLCTDQAAVSGILHLCNSGVASWCEYAQATVDIAHELGLLPVQPVVLPQRLEGFPLLTARRPPFTPLSNALLTARTGIVPDPWQVPLRRYLARLPRPQTSGMVL